MTPCGSSSSVSALPPVLLQLSPARGTRRHSCCKVHAVPKVRPHARSRPVSFAWKYPLPANWQHNAVSVAVGSGAGGEPGALAWLDRHAAGLVAGRGLAVAVSVFLIQLIIAAAVLGRWH